MTPEFGGIIAPAKSGLNIITKLPTEPHELLPVFKVRGGNKLLMEARDTEIVAEGPSGTGKTRTILELINLLCHKYPGLRVLIVRKHAVTLTNTCLVTFNEKVLRPQDGVSFFGGSKSEAAAYRYPNGSRIIVGGMDDPDKILSSEYDLIYENEGTELTEESHETLLTRLRNGVLPNMRVIADCNPTAAKNWLHVRCDQGKARVIYTKHSDNPYLFNDDGTPTQAGRDYLATLDKLSGTRRKRFLLGQRVGVENAIYPHFDRDIHVRDLEPGLRFTTGAVGVDYGRRHKGASIPISVDQYGRRWVREAWAEVVTPDNTNLTTAVSQHKLSFGIRRGRVDPNQGALGGMLGFNVADGSNGSRNNRTKLTGRLFNYFPGGRVPSVQLELNQQRFLREFPQPPFKEPDSPGLLFVKGAPGIDELCDQIEDYHEVYIQTDRKEDFEVARINEDMVAALEYAIEELESPAYEYRPPEATLAFGEHIPAVSTARKPLHVHGGVT